MGIRSLPIANCGFSISIFDLESCQRHGYRSIDNRTIDNRQCWLSVYQTSAKAASSNRIEKIAQAIESVKGAVVLGRHMDVDHNRSVITFVAAPGRDH
jgi:hypothetical protein